MVIIAITFSILVIVTLAYFLGAFNSFEDRVEHVQVSPGEKKDIFYYSGKDKTEKVSERDNLIGLENNITKTIPIVNKDKEIEKKEDVI